MAAASPERRRVVRVVVIHPRDLAAPTTGGIQTFLHDFVKHSPEDFEIVVAGVTTDGRTRPIGRRQRVSVDGRSAWTLPLARHGRLARGPVDLVRMAIAQLRLHRLLLGRRTIVQIHRPFRPILLVGQRGPLVQFVHLDIRDWPGPSGWPRLERLYRPFSDRALKRMSRIYVVNETGAQLLAEDHPELADRIEFLPVWFDEQVFRPAAAGQREPERADLTERFGLPSDAASDAWVLLAGRLDPFKDPILALDAFAQLVAGEQRARLLVAGDGEMREALEQHVERLGIGGRVDFLGALARPELARLMRVSDTLLLTSRAEGGGPRVVLEALASGLPVVATDVGEVRRTVVDQVNGRIVRPTAHDLAEGIGWVLDRERAGLAEKAVEAVRPYTARAALAPLYEAYRRLAAR